MKKALAVIMVFLMLCGCNPQKQDVKKHSGVWLSYSEVNTMLENGFEAEFQKLIENCQSLEINNLYIHVRAFGDSLYESEIFPPNEKTLKYEFDILKYVIDLCHQNDISVHAWINPYRISLNENIEELNPQSSAYLWLHDDNTENNKNVCFSNGIYLNPAEDEVQQLIINGVREIVKNYNIDGIHFDDYFYPTQSEEFDKLSYTKYTEQNRSPLDLSSWRRLNVDLLLSGTYNAIKYIEPNVIFSVSPAASVDKNYNDLYADVRSWVNNGFVDAIIPQIYFGFEYPDENFKFENLLNVWQNVAALNPDVSLYIGLAFYKSKPTLAADITEWQQNEDIIKRQVEILDQSRVAGGYLYFSYSSLFGDESEYKAQRENLVKYLKKKD